MACSSTPSSTQLEDFLRVQLDNVDSYQTAPTALDIRHATIGGKKYTFPQVPVIRVFGATLDGMKALLHIHGVFPYLYIMYNGPVDNSSGKYLLWKHNTIR